MIDSEEGYEGKNFQKKEGLPPVEFKPFYLSDTAGDGVIKKNNLKNGGAQGKSSFILKAGCRVCGFPVDLNRNDHSGGSLDGNGANFVQSTGTATVTLASGAQHTENYGTPGTRPGDGCPGCGTKNPVLQRVVNQSADQWQQRQKFGF